MANYKMKKVVALVAVFALIVMIIPMAALADNVGVTASQITADVPTIETTGTIAGSGDITFLAIRSTASLNGIIPDPLDEDAIMYVDQKAADTSGQATWTFELRDTATDGRWVTVFMGTSDADYGWAEVYLAGSLPYGIVNLYYNGKSYYNAGERVLDLSEAAQGWKDSVNIVVYDGEEEVGYIVDEILYLDNEEPNELTTYTIKFEDANDYLPVEDLTIDVISADGAKLVEFDGVPELDNSGEDAWTVTIPASTTDVAVTVTVDGVDKTADIVGGVLTVARNDVGGEDKAVVVTATAGNASKSWSFTITAKGSLKPAMDVTLTKNAYSITGARVATIKIADTDIDPLTKTVKVVDTEFFYSPERSKDGVVVYVAVLRENNESEAMVADLATIEEKAASVIYYAKPNDPTKSNAVIPADVNKALAMYKAGKTMASLYTDAQLLSADVTGSGNVIPASVNAILAAYKNKSKAALNILK